MRIIKFLITSLVSIVLLMAVVIGGVTTLIDPNDHKEFITSSFSQATGRYLTLVGDIEFTLFPKLGIQLGNTYVSNAEGFSQETFAQLDNVIIRADLLSLLMFQLKADTIELHGLQVNLEKNKAGNTNWQDLIATTDLKKPQTKDQLEKNSSSSVPLGIEVAGIKISDARFTYEDALGKNTITVDRVNFDSGAIGRPEFAPINATLRVAQTASQSIVELSLGGKMMLDLKAAQLQLRGLAVDVQAKSPDLPEAGIKLGLNTQLKYDYAHEALSLSDMRLAFNDMVLVGTLSLQSFTQPNIKFSVHADEIDLDEMLVAPSHTDDASSSDVVELPLEHIRQMMVAGDVSVNTLRTSGLELTDLKSLISIQQGVAQVKKLTFNLYEGSYAGTAEVDVSRAVPMYSARGQLKGLAIGELLQALSDNKRSLIRGQSELGFTLQTSGQRLSGLKKKLQGKLSFRAVDGALQNQDLAKNIEYVVAFLQGRSPKVSGKEIIFNSFSASAVIDEGILSNQDLVLVAPLISATGNGQVDLASERIAYTLNIGMAGKGSKKLPISITGPFTDPKYNFDMKSVITGQQKQKIKEKLLEGAGEKLGDDLKKQIKKFKFF